MYDGVTMMIVGPEVGDQPDLPLGLPARDRDDRAPEPLGAVVGAEPAGEQAVAVGDVDRHAGPAAGGADAAGDDVGPGGEVAVGVADDGRLSGGAAAGVDAPHLVPRHGEHAEGVVRPQVVLRRERELRAGRPARVRSPGATPAGVERLPVVRDVVVGVLQAPPQPLELQRARAARPVAVSTGVEVRRVRGQVSHGRSTVTGDGVQGDGVRCALRAGLCAGSSARLRPRNSSTTSSPRRTVTSYSPLRPRTTRSTAVGDAARRARGRARGS